MAEKLYKRKKCVIKPERAVSAFRGGPIEMGTLSKCHLGMC